MTARKTVRLLGSLAPAALSQFQVLPVPFVCVNMLVAYVFRHGRTHFGRVRLAHRVQIGQQNQVLTVALSYLFSSHDACSARTLSITRSLSYV